MGPRIRSNCASSEISLLAWPGASKPHGPPQLELSSWWNFPYLRRLPRRLSHFRDTHSAPQRGSYFCSFSSAVASTR
ncbi:hypothetical protein BDZ85DRAFT_255136 [Elsinoe ampelina]|uniref:Uncharacterized protein n=1 Tax=Elsinoe ampelina TaxID=302913 RepID=A0A6A6GQB2_9PEZI|nr:hypothetical protein BDZ85DRAFT_255136 [Elsinoe ampelina]